MQDIQSKALTLAAELEYADKHKADAGDVVPRKLVLDAAQTLREVQGVLERMESDVKFIVRQRNTCLCCASDCDDADRPDGAPDCDACMRQSLWTWRGWGCSDVTE